MRGADGVKHDEHPPRGKGEKILVPVPRRGVGQRDGAPADPNDAGVRRGGKRGDLEMRFVAWPANRVAVALETASRSCTREHRQLVRRGNFASEHKHNGAHPFKRSSGLSATSEVGRGIPHDLVRSRDRDATVAAFDPRVERAAADRAFAPEADDKPRFLHGTDEGVWNIAGMQVDGTAGRDSGRSCLWRRDRSAARTSAADENATCCREHNGQRLCASHVHAWTIGSAVGFLEAMPDGPHPRRIVSTPA